MGADHVALLRGINVGNAKSVSMPMLVSVFEKLGFSDVRTLLRSGNVVFAADGASVDPALIERAVLEATGVQSSVLVLTASQLRSIASANPLGEVATDGSKSFVTFLSEPHGEIEVPDAGALAPELLRVGDAAVYQWMPYGSLQTKVPKSFWRQFSGHVTARNANTVAKLLGLLDG